MIRMKIFLSAVFLMLSVPGLLNGAVPASERAALIAFYNAAGGDNWYNNSGWKEGTLEPDGFGPVGSEGTWHGITVSEDHVTEISLSWNNLTGTLSPELGKLVYLEKIALSVTQMSGSIPPELGNLVNLTSLSLSHNQLTGSIPSELGYLVNLTSLSLNHNHLTGSIPPELGNLDNLEYLVLGSNLLSGSIPPELGNLDKLENLNLDDNQLSGAIPPELGSLHRLTWLNLQRNRLSAGIPPELGNLAVLEVLYLHYNQLTGTIPPELGNLSLLRDFHLTRNQLSGDIPPELGNLGSVEFFYAGENQLSGSIPPELGNLSRMTRLYLDNNSLSGNLPSELGNLSKLGQLLLQGNRLVGCVPSGFTNLNLLYKFSIAYNGVYSDEPTVRGFLSRLEPWWDESQTIAPSELSVEALSSSSVKISWEPIFYVEDSGGYLVYYSTTSGGPWTYAGKTKDKSAESYEVTGLGSGMKYFIVKTQTDPNLHNANTVVSEASEEVYCAIGSIGPFGEFSTPLDGAVVSSSVPVTGWALDDIEVKHVLIYREQGTSLVYIGTAVFVEGARPDVEQAYPGYPNNSKAGWGYMMLTNFLPNGGNGTFRIHAVASDAEGHQVTLGIKTITCDNANAVKPFGAIDFPSPGDTAVGNDYRNQGWVLTPMPNMIPIDGSTIGIYIDGVLIGHPTYNGYREDIAALFPGYANSDGSWAYFNFDTTLYTDGVHTIYWTAEDDAGNSDGIGSRYFVIQNSTRRSLAIGHLSLGKNNLSGLLLDDSTPVMIKQGYNRDAEPIESYPSGNGIITIELREMERIEIRLVQEAASGLAPLSIGHAPLHSAGYQMVGDQLKPLPIGSTLDVDRGIFYWQPGPGFIGEYRFIFIEKRPFGELNLKKININIAPR